MAWIHHLRPTEQRAIRALTVVLFVAALIYGLLILDIPKHQSDLPSIALRSTLLYRVELLLALIYGGLLLITPFIYGLSRGELPVELSPRGARWREAADESLKAQSKLVTRLREDFEGLSERLIQLEFANEPSDREDEGKVQ